MCTCTHVYHTSYRHTYIHKYTNHTYIYLYLCMMYRIHDMLHTCIFINTCIYLYIRVYIVHVQENFSKGGRAGIFDLYPVVLYLFVRCFLILFGGRFGRVSRGTLPILATIHAELVELQRVLLLFKTFLLFFD